jgi:hypothetical protein
MLVRPHSFYRQRRPIENSEESEAVEDDEENQILHGPTTSRNDGGSSSANSERTLLVMAQNHMLAFVLTLYMLYALCRLLGWKPGVRSPTYTITFGKPS